MLGGQGGGYLGDPDRAHRYFNKKLYWHPAPSGPEGVLYTYCYKNTPNMKKQIAVLTTVESNWDAAITFGRTEQTSSWHLSHFRHHLDTYHITFQEFGKKTPPVIFNVIKCQILATRDNWFQKVLWNQSLIFVNFLKICLLSVQTSNAINFVIGTSGWCCSQSQ